MKPQKRIFLTIFLILTFIFTTYIIYSIFYKNNNNSKNINQNISAERISSQTTTTPENIPKKEESIELTSFSTKLLSKNKNRTNNIKITCETLNDTIIQPQETFSFCHTIGKPTSEKGYKLANSYGHSGEIIQTIGGGNCQVCTTLYNAVLNLPNLKVIERHPHSHKVSYVPEGKDATCAYDYLDFKFINNYNEPIKINSSIDDSNVYVTIYQIKK